MAEAYVVEWLFSFSSNNVSDLAFLKHMLNVESIPSLYLISIFCLNIHQDQ